MTQSVHEFLKQWGCAAFAEAVAAGAREVRPGRVPTAPNGPLPSKKMPDALRLADLLSGLPAPPPACTCRRGGAILLGHKEDRDRRRVVRLACDGWDCPVCRQRNAYDWVAHLAECVQDAAAGGRTLYVMEATKDRFGGRITKALRRKGAEWCALELLPGVLLVVMALPEGANPPARAELTGLVNVCAKLVAWAKDVRTGDRPFSKLRKKARPVRTSAGWRLNRPEKESDWETVKEDGVPLVVDTLSPDSIIDVLRERGARITCDVTGPDERRGPSFVWLVEWRADPETQARIVAGLKDIDERPAPPPPGAKRRPEDDPGWTPFEGVP